MKRGDLKEEQGKMRKAYKNLYDAHRCMFKRVMETRAELYEHISNAKRTAFKARIIERISRDDIDISKVFVRGAIS